jgi:hypothetical protein
MRREKKRKGHVEQMTRKIEREREKKRERTNLSKDRQADNWLIRDENERKREN